MWNIDSRPEWDELFFPLCFVFWSGLSLSLNLNLSSREGFPFTHSSTHTLLCPCYWSGSCCCRCSTGTIACCKSALLKGTVTMVTKGGLSIPRSLFFVQGIKPVTFSSSTVTTLLLLWPTSHKSSIFHFNSFQTCDFYCLLGLFLVLNCWCHEVVYICGYFYINSIIVIFSFFHYGFLKVIDSLCPCGCSYSCEPSASFWDITVNIVLFQVTTVWQKLWESLKFRVTQNINVLSMKSHPISHLMNRRCGQNISWLFLCYCA